MKRFAVIVLALVAGFVVALFSLFYFKDKKAGVPKDYKLVLALEGEGIKLKLYTRDGSLKVGKNSIFVETEPKVRVESLYFYMPPMPGMGEMREDATLKEVERGLYQGFVDLSMAGSWQLIVQVEGKTIKRDLSIPFGGEVEPTKREEGISVSPEKLQLIGVQVQEVGRQELVESFYSVGYVSYDLSKTYEITLRSDAWVLDTFGRFEGELIKAGTPLMRVLNPDVEIAKEELKLAKEIGRKELEEAVLKRLEYLKV
ncbi:MAG: FixH family protein, partial [Aquificaceae bacterium]